jgi:hypothetical protein
LSSLIGESQSILKVLLSCPLLIWSWRLLVLHIPSMSMIVIGESLLY